MQPTAAEWLSQAEATKQILEHFIAQARTPVDPKVDAQPTTTKLQDQGRIINSGYWVKDDPRINQWLSYPGIPVMLQRTQSVLDLLEEVSNQAPQGRQEILSPGSTLAETIKKGSNTTCQNSNIGSCNGKCSSGTNCSISGYQAHAESRRGHTEGWRLLPQGYNIDHQNDDQDITDYPQQTPRMARKEQAQTQRCIQKKGYP